MRLSLLLFLFIHMASARTTAQPAQSGFSPPGDTVSRPVLLVFSGSDWCQPCIRFDKQVLQDTVFQHFATTHLDVVKADFPQRKKLPSAQVRENERLAGLYNPAGQFPHIVLLRPDRTVWAILPADAGNGRAFVSLLKTYLPQQ